MLIPIIMDPDGTVIDGHHRKEIAERLGVPYEVIYWPERLLRQQRRMVAERFRVLHDLLCSG